MTQWTEFCQVIGDSLLGWSLKLPADLTLLVVAGVTAIFLTLVRVATCDQDRSRRYAADKTQLRRLVRQAQRRADSEAVARYRGTLRLIKRRSLLSEIVPALVASIPIAGLLTWCGQRLEFHAPQPGETIKLEITTPVADAGQLAHLVPEDGITSDGWVREIEFVADRRGRRGMAEWEISAAPRESPYELTVRHGSENLRHELLVGARVYSSPVVVHAPGTASRFQYEPYRPFGWLPGLPLIGVPAWLTGYLILALPLVSLLRRFLRVHY